MTSFDRHSAVVQLVGQFKQVTPADVQELLFTDTKTPGPMRRTLQYLEKLKYLRQLPHPQRGGSQGGRGANIWVLGSDAFSLLGLPVKPQRGINYHTLAITNLHRHLVRLERAGKFEIVSYLTEPWCHEKIDEHIIDSDYFVELQLPDGRHKVWWVEMDMAVKHSESESPKRIRQKLKRYCDLYHDTNTRYWPDYLYKRDEHRQVIYDRYEVDGRTITEARRWFPLVHWIVQDDFRHRQLTNLVRELKPDDQKLFRVMSLPQLVQSFD